MNLFDAKISLILIICIFLTSCNSVKHLKEKDYLLTKNAITLDGKKVSDRKLHDLLYQKPNSKLLGVLPLRLHMYNLGKQNPDSIFDIWLHKKLKREKRLTALLSQKQVEKLRDHYIGFNKWKQKIGEAPTIIDEVKVKRSKERLSKYFKNLGWFNAITNYTVDETGEKRAAITYNITRKTHRLHQQLQPNLAHSLRTRCYVPVHRSLVCLPSPHLRGYQ